MSQWQCIKMCGACCHLEPEERPGLEEYLTSQELNVYLSMVGDDGWCINFDQDNRECKIYLDRPRFCRVQPDIFKDMYDVEADEFNDFAIDCCHEQIDGVYGDDTPEMERYIRQVG